MTFFALAKFISRERKAFVVPLRSMESHIVTSTVKPRQSDHLWDLFKWSD